MSEIREREPLYHSFITDMLPDDHPLAWKAASCADCGALLHAANECMREWMETGLGNFCLACFAKRIADSYERPDAPDSQDYALPGKDMP